MYVYERTGQMGCGYQKYRVNRVQNQLREELKVDVSSKNEPLLIFENIGGQQLSGIILSLSPRRHAVTPRNIPSMLTTPLETSEQQSADFGTPRSPQSYS